MPAAFAIPAAIQTGLGLYQAIRGSAMRPQRPKYERPSEIDESLASARREADGRMPGISYAYDRLDQNRARGAYDLKRAARNPGQLLAGLSNINMQANIAERGILESEATDQYRRLANLRRNLQLMASYKDREFQMNEMDPYMDASRTKAALTQSGLLNIAGGANSAVSGLYAAQMMGQNQQQQPGFNPFVNMALDPNRIKF